MRRAFELRVTRLNMDEMAHRFVRDCARSGVRLIANEPDGGGEVEYREKLRQIMADHDIPGENGLMFAEVTVTGCCAWRARRCRPRWPRCC